ncbi:hypothetical protein D3C85_1621460 [compost metagenome]
MQVDQAPIQVQRDQQIGAALAQAVGANSFGCEVWVVWRGAASIAPPVVGLLGGLLLAPVLLGLALAPGLINSLAELRGFVGVNRLTTTPAAGAAGFPTAERARGDTV